MKDFSFEGVSLETIAMDIRRDAISAIYSAGSGHPGGSLSAADILTVLYFKEMNIRCNQPDWEDRDRFVLSKGHGCPAYYAALARRGFFPLDELRSLRCLHSRLQGHPCMGKTPGVDMSSGSLGQGFSVAAGMALYAKKRSKSYKVYCIIGDGECQEGQVWETAMSSAHFALDNFIVFLDANHLQIDGAVDEVMNIYPVCEKFRAFGWNAIQIDGHDIGAIIGAVEIAKQSSGKPTLIQCSTVKGKGVDFMENQVKWHGRGLNDSEYALAMEQLTKAGADIQ